MLDIQTVFLIKLFVLCLGSVVFHEFAFSSWVGIYLERLYSMEDRQGWVGQGLLVSNRELRDLLTISFFEKSFKAGEDDFKRRHVMEDKQGLV